METRSPLPPPSPRCGGKGAGGLGGNAPGHPRDASVGSSIRPEVERDLPSLAAHRLRRPLHHGLREPRPRPAVGERLHLARDPAPHLDPRPADQRPRIARLGRPATLEAHQPVAERDRLLGGRASPAPPARPCARSPPAAAAGAPRAPRRRWTRRARRAAAAAARPRARARAPPAAARRPRAIPGRAAASAPRPSSSSSAVTPGLCRAARARGRPKATLPATSRKGKSACCCGT